MIDWKILAEDLMNLIAERHSNTELCQTLYDIGYTKKMLKQLGFDKETIKNLKEE